MNNLKDAIKSSLVDRNNDSFWDCPMCNFARQKQENDNGNACDFCILNGTFAEGTHTECVKWIHRYSPDSNYSYRTFRYIREHLLEELLVLVELEHIEEMEV